MTVQKIHYLPEIRDNSAAGIVASVAWLIRRAASLGLVKFTAFGFSMVLLQGGGVRFLSLLSQLDRSADCVASLR